MKSKLITLLSTAAIFVSLAMPSASAQEQVCENTQNWNYYITNSQNIKSEIFDKLCADENIDIKNILNSATDTDQLKEVIQSQLTKKLDESCTTDQYINALNNECTTDDNTNSKQPTKEKLNELLQNVCDENIDELNNVLAKANEECVDDAPVPTPTLPDKAPVATDAPIVSPEATLLPTAMPTSTAGPIATTPVPAATPIATSVPATIETPVPTAKPTLEPTPIATSAPTSNATGVSNIEKRMVDLVNQDRAAAGLSPLAIDTGLTNSARAHSMDMSASNYFSHTSPTYGSFSQRLKSSNLSFSSAGENIALYNSVDKAQAALMASDGHRANILGKSFTHIGIGIEWNESKGAYYITQWFARK